MLSNTQGSLNRAAGTDFEKRIASSFQAYAEIDRAYLDFMPLPMTTCGQRHPHLGIPLYMPKGKAPFDIYGYAPRTMPVSFNGIAIEGLATLGLGRLAIPSTRIAQFVGAELKSSGDPQTSLAIVPPDSHAKGLAFHQLDALALVAKIGGVARVVWDNGGQIGVLSNERIVHHHVIYTQSLASEARGKGKGKLGSRSIPWEAFSAIEPLARVANMLIVDWLRF